MLENLTDAALTVALDVFFVGTPAFAIAAFLERLLDNVLAAFFNGALAVAITVSRTPTSRAIVAPCCRA